MTIKDIARLCGVSVSTVSRVLNNRPDVSPEVRQRVLSMVEDHNYIPNNSARDLVKTQSDTLGVVVRGMSNLFFAEVLKAVTQTIDSRGYTAVMRQIGSDGDELKTGAVLEREKKLRGLLFLGGRFDYTPGEAALLNVPFVCCSYTNWFGSLREEDFASVSIDDRAAAHQAVSHLLALGHRRIAAVVPSRSDRSISELRYMGYRAALADWGIPLDPALVAECGGCFEMAEAYAAVERLLAAGAEFTALFTLSDTMAMAAIKALTDHGVRVPEDCSVVGIDGIPLSAYTVPTLTTLVQPAEEMGRESVALLLSMVEGTGGPRHVRMETALRQGSSCAAVRQPVVPHKSVERE